ncbi:hypothetical protein J3R30DRAFT_3704156 [Lentinula aciculospora]|uniref:C3H1-type domain-containing protein n=1 Tax=Lentinula aciculospora TaxID=153920 RepID=A0A9W9A805_9AGAR|nr:hypothetical protein J3R30DRAFT_3704156 [Lentinula aciculospora]
MHEALTTSTKNYAPDDLLPPIYLTNRPQLIDSLDWQSDHQASENWPPHRAFPLASQKLSISTTMSSHTENVMNRSRWYFNPDGQLVDADALANEIVRLNIGDSAGEATDDAPIRTPPKNKLASVVLADTSPLETNSIPSTDSSPKASDHQIVVSHSRGSSTDTTISSQDSAMSSSSNAMLAHAPLKSGSINELKERPHSFSGGLSSADLRRLQQADEGFSDDNNQLQQQQQQQWSSNQPSGEQLSYPSLTPNNQLVHHRSQTHQAQQGPQNSNRDVTSPIDYNIQARNFNAPLQPGMTSSISPTSPPYIQGRSNNVPVPYRQPPRGFGPQQGLPLPSPGYAHNGQIPPGNSQQLYDMMLPGAAPHDPAHPAVSRVQQQHNVFPRAHHHSASDPTAIRDPTAIAMLNNGMPPFPAGMFPANLSAAPPPQMPMYPPSFYGAQDAYRSDAAAVAAAQVMANRIQAQYTGQYTMVPPQLDGGMSSPSSSAGNQNGPSANNRKLGLYKTELCRSWEEKGSCRYGAKCQFAHGEEELRNVSRHPKYKTEICRTFWVSGSCPYGKRCCFIHTELPNAGPPPGQQVDAVSPPPPRSDGRERSPSTNSDPNEAVSLLARISAKRTQDSGSNSSSTPVDNSVNTFQFGGVQKQRLKVDTSTLDRNTMKGQNKSAYPSFASNGVLMAAPDNISAKSPAPVTAGPDLGRHNNARLEIVGYNQRMNQTPPSNIRHTTTGSEDISYQASQSMTGNSYILPSGDGNPSAPRVNGHVRAGSAGNWGNFTSNRPIGQFPASAYPHGASPAGDGPVNSPWSTTDLTMGPSRLNEKAWA